jgi:hypothetical protein
VRRFRARTARSDDERTPKKWSSTFLKRDLL